MVAVCVDRTVLLLHSKVSLSLMPCGQVGCWVCCFTPIVLYSRAQSSSSCSFNSYSCFTPSLMEDWPVCCAGWAHWINTVIMIITIVLMSGLQQEQLLATLKGHSGQVNCAEFCPNYSSTLVTAGDDRTFKVPIDLIVMHDVILLSQVFNICP